MKQIHGGDVYSHRNCIDFSANCSPLGTPEGVKKAAADALDHIQDYPQVGYEPLRKALSVYEGVAPENIICGNGAAELIFTLCQAAKPKQAMMAAPTFAEYEAALKSVDCEIEYVYLKEKNNFALDDEFIDQLHKGLDIVFLCNPNNPTGILIDREFLFRVLRVCREMEILLVVDECFLDFVANEDQYTLKAQLSRYHNLFLLKAFTKRYAMAGLRLGYGITENRGLLNKMEACVQPWNLSVIAQAAGVAALKETEHVEKSRTVTLKELPYLKQELAELGFCVYPSEANYIFFSGPEGLAEAVVREGVLIRDCSNYTGLRDGYYRVAVRTHEENYKLVQALSAALSGLRS